VVHFPPLWLVPVRPGHCDFRQSGHRSLGIFIDHACCYAIATGCNVAASHRIAVP